VLGGGGQDKGQSLISDDLRLKASGLQEFANAGVPMLMICGMYQMFGHYFKTSEGKKIPGVGILDVYTEAGPGRLIGNISVQTEKWGSLIGYENHSGLTTLGDKASALGSTQKQQGNNGNDYTEGAVQNNVFGSYLHGPMLAKSPQFADYLLSLALESAGMSEALTQLDEHLEVVAAGVAKTRPR
jgi:CobQ-like glutamine amidotransferase family enzyme